MSRTRYISKLAVMFFFKVSDFSFFIIFFVLLSTYMDLNYEFFSLFFLMRNSKN